MGINNIIEAGFEYEVESLNDWVEAMREVRKYYEDAVKDVQSPNPPQLKGRTYIKIGDKRVEVQGTYGLNEDGRYELTNLVTRDQFGNAANTETLHAQTRAVDPAKVKEALKGKGSEIIYSEVVAAVEIGISEQNYGGRAAMIAAMIALDAAVAIRGKDNLRYPSLYIGAEADGGGNLQQRQSIWHKELSPSEEEDSSGRQKAKRVIPQSNRRSKRLSRSNVESVKLRSAPEKQMEKVKEKTNNENLDFLDIETYAQLYGGETEDDEKQKVMSLLNTMKTRVAEKGKRRSVGLTRNNLRRTGVTKTKIHEGGRLSVERQKLSVERQKEKRKGKKKEVRR